MNIWSAIPLMRAAIAFALGVLLQSRLELCLWQTLVLVVFGCLLFFLFSKIHNARKSILSRRSLLASYHLLFLILGVMVKFLSLEQDTTAQLKEQWDNFQFFEGEIVSEMVESGSNYQFEIELLSGFAEEQSTHLEGKVMLLLSKDSLAEAMGIGDYIGFEHQNLVFPRAKNEGDFDYQTFLESKGISGQLFLRRHPLYLRKSEKKDSAYWLSALRRKMGKLLEEEIKNEAAQDLIYAMVLGDKSKLDKSTKSAFSNAGAMHILAVSGLHVGIVYLFISFFLGYQRKRVRGVVIKGCIILLVLWVFAALTGFSASVLRASLMFSSMILARMVGGKSWVFNAIGTSALLLLFLNPDLIFDVGFQLSYAAVLAILMIQPKLQRLWRPRFAVVRFLWALSTVSIAAQLGTFPLALYYFHSFPVYFLLANLFVIPLTSLILYLALLFFALSFFDWTKLVLGWMLEFFATLLHKCTLIVGQLDGAALQGVFISLISVVLLYGWLGGLLAWWYRKQGSRLLVAMSCGLALCVLRVDKIAAHQKQQFVQEINVWGETVVLCAEGRNAIVLHTANKSNAKDKVAKSCQTTLARKGIRNVVYLNWNEAFEADAANFIRTSAGLVFGDKILAFEDEVYKDADLKIARSLFSRTEEELAQIN